MSTRTLLQYNIYVLTPAGSSIRKVKTFYLLVSSIDCRHMMLHLFLFSSIHWLFTIHWWLRLRCTNISLLLFDPTAKIRDCSNDQGNAGYSTNRNTSNGFRRETLGWRLVRGGVVINVMIAGLVGYTVFDAGRSRAACLSTVVAAVCTTGCLGSVTGLARS
jgi:hypothetical protein